MRLFRWKRERDPQSVQVAKEEADQAERQLASIVARRDESLDLERKGRAQRLNNHFGESIDLAMKRRHAI